MADVRIVELPIIHVFVPVVAGVLAGARTLIAPMLGCRLDAFDVTFEDPWAPRTIDE
jgi:hypothetical protein